MKPREATASRSGGETARDWKGQTVTDPTTPGPGESGPAGLRQARDALRAAVESLLDGHGLKIRELPHDFLVSNPREPEKGYVYIGIPDGHAAWKHTVWDHFGSLTDADP